MATAFLQQPAHRCMSESFVTVSDRATLRDVAGTLRVRDIGLLLVTGGIDELVGVIGERDVVTAVADCDDLDVVLAADRARADIITIAMDAPLQACLELMMEAGTRHLIVVDAARQPIGVISARDIMSELTQA